MQKAVFVVVFASAVSLAVLAGYFFGIFTVESQIIDRINKQLEFMDAGLCKADSVQVYATPIGLNWTVNKTSVLGE
jgi:hypothetical protein